MLRAAASRCGLLIPPPPQVLNLTVTDDEGDVVLPPVQYYFR